MPGVTCARPCPGETRHAPPRLIVCARRVRAAHRRELAPGACDGRTRHRLSIVAIRRMYKLRNYESDGGVRGAPSRSARDLAPSWRRRVAVRWALFSKPQSSAP